MVARARGFTVLEVVVALAVLTIVATSVMVGERGQLRQVGHSFDELMASRIAAGRLEVLATARLVPGETVFDVEEPGLEGVQRIRELTPGLFEVRVSVQRPGGREFRLTTLMTREEGR